MADLKISQTTATTTPTSDDLVPLVDDPGGTPTTKHSTLGNLAAAMAGMSGLTSAFARVHTATRAYLSTSVQSIGSGAITLVNLNGVSFDDTGVHFTSAANLTGTVDKTASSATLTGTGTAFTSELSVGQIISVPGTAAEIRVVTAVASDTSLTVNSPYANSASGQTASRQNHGIVAPEAGRYLATGGVDIAVNTANDRLAAIYLNAAALTAPTGTRIAVATNEASGALNDRFNISTGPIDLAQWDYVSLAAFQNSGGPLDVAAGEYVTWLALERLS